MSVHRHLLVFATCLGVLCAGQSLEELIKNTNLQSEPSSPNNTPEPTLYRSTPSYIPNQPASPPDEYVQSSTCTCVPYYLCNNNSINTDGAGLIDIRQKEENICETYIEVCCEQPLSDGERGTSTLPVIPHDGCGKRNQDGIVFRITGSEDNESEFGEFPWIVAILKEDSDGKNNVFQCGGSLIHPEVVMTAAHCVKSGNKYKVRLGEWDTQTELEIFKHQDIYVSSVVIHPKYYAGALHNDIALLFLDSPADLGNNVDVVCMPSQFQVFDYSRCFVSGWGRDVFGKEGKYQVILKKVELPIVPRDICQNALRLTRLGQQFNLHSSFLCAGGEPNRDACKGDGGSPLVCPIGDTGRYAQAGIVAWGIGCGEQGTPGVYANVATFRDWVDDQLRRRNLDTTFYQST